MDRSRLQPLLDAVMRLIQADVTWMGVAGAYHARGVAPLMRRSLPLNMMTDSIEPSGTVLRGGRPSDEAIVALLKDAFEDPVPGFPFVGHPPMHPDPGAIVIVSVRPCSSAFFRFYSVPCAC